MVKEEIFYMEGQQSFKIEILFPFQEKPISRRIFLLPIYAALLLIFYTLLYPTLMCRCSLGTVEETLAPSYVPSAEVMDKYGERMKERSRVYVPLKNPAADDKGDIFNIKRRQTGMVYREGEWYRNYFTPKLNPESKIFVGVLAITFYFSWSVAVVLFFFQANRASRVLEKSRLLLPEEEKYFTALKIKKPGYWIPGYNCYLYIVRTLKIPGYLKKLAGAYEAKLPSLQRTHIAGFFLTLGTLPILAVLSVANYENTVLFLVLFSLGIADLITCIILGYIFSWRINLLWEELSANKP